MRNGCRCEHLASLAPAAGGLSDHTGAYGDYLQNGVCRQASRFEIGAGLCLSGGGVRLTDALSLYGLSDDPGFGGNRDPDRRDKAEIVRGSQAK